MTYDAILQWIRIAAWLIGIAGFIGMVVSMRPWVICCPPRGQLFSLSLGVSMGALIVGSGAAVVTVLLGPV